MTMACNHTPGPWEARGKFVSDCADTLGGMYAIRRAGGQVIGAFDKAEDRAIAAEAPAMLAALREIAWRDQRDGRFAEIARAILARIDGET